MGMRLKYLYRAFRYRYRVDPAELRFIGARLRPGQVAVDAGCHKGAYTYWMRRRVGASGTVLAFEPQPSQVAYLEQAFRAMRYRNVTLVPKALSSVPGRLQLNIPVGAGASTHGASLVHKDAPGGAWNSIEVDVTTLDTVFFGADSDGLGRCDFIKIDVEGHELAVLEGAARLVDEYHPALLVECEARHRADGDTRPVFDFFQSRGYSGSFFCSGRRRPLAEFRQEEHQPRIARNEKPPEGYVNNFAFERD